MKRTQISLTALTATLCVLFPNQAAADAVVPMVALGFPFMLVAFVPVCLIEIWFYARASALPWKRLCSPVLIANGASTLVGYPLSWALLLGVETVTTMGQSEPLNAWTRLKAVTLQAAWLIPYESELHWMVPVAGMVGLVPAFFISVWMERLVLKRFSFGEMQFPIRGIWRANMWSYAFLLVLLLLMLL